MLFLSYAYRFLSNFVFLGVVYLALNFLEKYQHRVVVAVLVLSMPACTPPRHCDRFTSSSASSGWRSRHAAWWRRRRGAELDLRAQTGHYRR